MRSAGRHGRVVGLLLVAVLALGCGGEEPVDQTSAEGSTDSGDDSAGRPGARSPGGTGQEAGPGSLPELAARKLRRQAERRAGESDRPPVLGGDISWPQCPRGMGIPQKRSLGIPLPIAAAEYVVIGLTNGPGFFPNPCLAEQVDYAREKELLVAAYSVSSFPSPAEVAQHARAGPFDGDTRLGALSNTGYQQALFNVASMERTGFRTPVVWIDVEPVPDFEWSDDLVANSAVVTGIARAYRDEGYRIGIYSTPLLWETVVGDFALGVPEWRAAGETSRAEAMSRCGPDWQIQGGEPVMGQWVQANRDMNITCPGIANDMSRWFHQF